MGWGGDGCSINGGGRERFLSKLSLECGNQVSPMSSPLQGMKAQPLQSLFVGEVTHANYRPCS